MNNSSYAISALALSLLLAFHAPASAQPSISFDKDMDSKFQTIIKALPNLVKSFGTKPKSTPGSSRIQYTPSIKVGIAPINLTESETQEVLEISFTGSYYKGTVAEFQDFFNKLVNCVQVNLGATYSVKQTESGEKFSQFRFMETGKTITTSRVSIFIDYQTYSPDNPLVRISIYAKK